MIEDAWKEDEKDYNRPIYTQDPQENERDTKEMDPKTHDEEEQKEYNNARLRETKQKETEDEERAEELWKHIKKGQEGDIANINRPKQNQRYI